MNNRRSQISLFIIIGFLLLIVAGIILLVQNLKPDTERTIVQDLNFNQQITNIETYTQQCLKNNAFSTIAIFSSIGTTTNSPGGNLEIIEGLPVAYLRIDSNNYLPSIKEWEQTLNDFISLTNCDFNVYQDSGLVIEEQSITATTEIIEGKVNFDISYPLTITKDNNVKNLNNFKISLPIRLDYMHEIINTIITNEIEMPGFVPLSIMADFDLNVNATNIDGSDYIYILEETNPNYDKMILIFADKEGGLN